MNLTVIKVQGELIITLHILTHTHIHIKRECLALHVEPIKMNLRRCQTHVKHPQQPCQH